MIICGMILAVFALTVFFGAPYVPTHKSDLKKLFEELNLGESDILVDIGSGDGVVLIASEKFGARSIGFEINPFLVAVSKFRLRKSKKAKVFLNNFWRAFPIKKVTVLYTFGHGERIQKMFNLAQLQANSQNSPLKFVSYGFEIPERAASQKIGAHFIYQIKPEKSSQTPKNVI